MMLSPPNQLFSAQGETGYAGGMNVENFDTLFVTVATSGTTTATLKFQASLEDTEPSWGTAAARATNEWFYLGFYNATGAPATAVAGATGLAYAGTDLVQTLVFDVRGVKFFNAQVSAWTQGSIDVTARGYSEGEF